RSLKDLSMKLFDDTPASLVARLVNDDALTEEALGQIRALVDRRLKNDSG
ncbi:MAG: BlaI/MecI/CopY family transcriptional regulator, partial [Pseudomonadota bacterium]